MQNEEKQLEVSLDTLIHKTKDLKTCITSFLLKLENEYQSLHWPTVLDNFALISSQISSLSRLLKSEKCPAFRNYVVLPLVFSSEKDANLEVLTEGRLGGINHEIVPDYLRTKPQPEVEAKVNQITLKANSMGSEALQKQITSYTKILNQNIDTIKSMKDNWDSEMSDKHAVPQTWDRAHTHDLVAAVTHGKALKSSHRRPDMSRHQGSTSSGHIMRDKAGSAMKSNIRSTTHPYNRP